MPPDRASPDPQALVARLRRAWPSSDLRRVDVRERARCGDGLASTADRIGLELEFGPGGSGGLPERVILKTILLHRWLRFGMPAILATARITGALAQLPFVGRLASPAVFGLIGLYQYAFPHAPEPMYANEARFYRDIRPQLELEAPRAYLSRFDEGRRDFEIVMEDLRLRGASFPNALTEIPLAQIRALIEVLARLHGQLWQSPRLTGDLAWLPSTRRGGMSSVFLSIGLDLIRDQLRRHAFKRELIAPLGRSLEQLWSSMWRVQAELDAGPLTLCHGDAHIGNTYLLPDDRAGFLDWQLMVRGSWAHDLSYLLATGLSPEQRREHERALLDEYLERLAAHGVAQPPSREQAWLRYRQGMIWGLVIGWLITPPQNYGVEITSANITKMVRAMQDLDTLAVIP